MRPATILSRLKDESPSKERLKRARMHAQGWTGKGCESWMIEQGCSLKGRMGKDADSRMMEHGRNKE